MEKKLAVKDEYVEKLKSRIEVLENVKSPSDNHALREEHEELQKKYKHLKLKYMEKKEDLEVADQLQAKVENLKKARDGYRTQALEQKQVIK